MRTFPGCVVVLAGLALLAIAACDAPLPEQAFPDPTACTDASQGDQAGFEAAARPIFETYCSWCHWSDRSGKEDRKAAPAGVDYDDYTWVFDNTFSTWARLADRSMPPMGKLPSAEEYQTILDWLSCADALREQQRRGSGGDDDDSAS